MAGARVRTSTKRRQKNGGFDGVAKRTEKAKRGPRRVKFGLPVGAADYPDGTSVIEVGATHEFGSADGSIPERSWLRSSFREHLDEYRKMSAKLQAKVNRGDMSMREALELLGTKAAADAAQMIVDVTSPPNTAETIRRKRGSSNPLIDNGHLRQSVTHQVIEE